MLIKKADEPTYAEVTPKALYLKRREFLRAMGMTGAMALGSGVLLELAAPAGAAAANTKLDGVVKGPFGTDEKQTPYKDVTTYNNFYEFGTGKGDPVRNAQN